VESFKQGYRLGDDDLIKTFYRNSVYYSNSTGNFYSPYWISYEVGRFREDLNSYDPIGSLFRIPIELDTGVFRPNFIIGDKWDTGVYELKWKFKVSANAAEEKESVMFEVITEGILDSGLAVQYYQDLAGSFDII